MNYWLVKQEPESYSWSDFCRDGSAAWTGVRNFAARKNLQAMQKGDLVFFYHSVEEKQIVGLARVTRPAYPDPTAEEGNWVCVDLAPVKPLVRAVGLAAIKADAQLKEMPLVKQSRLSVGGVTRAQFERLMAMAETPAPGPGRG
jgi:predicted RNA-binding protein with PUA-like domain